ncbi:MAG TPA: hypothetical protein VGX76_12495, partial [Pirellulales bacterium]|nr:hypothetical protein [Pirellulales bacterium]
QALKSRQFAVTFTLVLAFAWVWSMMGVGIIGPGIRYGAEGRQMFAGYYVILSFAVLVIVPFGAFRSLAGEREDGTYELLSVTTLRPRQVVSGKLGSATLQMVVYFSAVAPCLGFTYMLRGVDAPTIAYVMVVLFLTSLGLSIGGMLVATATHEKHWQIVLSVALIFGLGWIFFMGCLFVVEELMRNAIPFDDAQFWIANLALLTGYLGFFALFYFTTAAQLTFASDNRSTPLRIVMLIQQATFIGWMGWGFFREGDLEYVYALLIVGGIYWYAMGAFLSGESGDLSRRVKRQLPQSFLGRALFTWFNPGPATGFLFAVVNLLTIYGLALAALLVGELAFPNRTRWGFTGNYNQTLAIFGGLAASYVVVYLGLGRLLIALVRKFAPVSLPAGVLLQFLLVLAGTGVPLTIHLMTPGMRESYSPIETTNPFWTLREVSHAGAIDDDTIWALFVVPLSAVALLLANLPAVVAAVRHVRIAKPMRVAEEDALVELQRAPPPVPINPFE